MYRNGLSGTPLRVENARPMGRLISTSSLFFLLLALGLLGGCEGERSVLAVAKPVKALTVVHAGAALAIKLPGEVRARTESTQAFRVGGRMTDRLVNIGDTVQAGQVLARLDPADQQLGADAAHADVAATNAALSTARDDLVRAQDLHRRKFVSQAALDHQIRGVEAAQARVNAASAQANLASRGVAYTQLRAAFAGVVKTVLAEPGQVLAAGQAVVEIARPDELEVHVTVAEDQVGLLRQAGDLRVSLWAMPDQQWIGRLREVAPVADPNTRTYAARIAFESSDPAVRLGMSATVRATHVRPVEAIRLPLAALVPTDGAAKDTLASVWVVDGSSRVVRASVHIDGFEENAVRVVAGLTAGQKVVVAGANTLYEGQLVRILDPS